MEKVKLEVEVTPLKVGTIKGYRVIFPSGEKVFVENYDKKKVTDKKEAPKKEEPKKEEEKEEKKTIKKSIFGKKK